MLSAVAALAGLTNPADPNNAVAATATAIFLDNFICSFPLDRG
jgi:hypothetical protein